MKPRRRSFWKSSLGGSESGRAERRNNFSAIPRMVGPGSPRPDIQASYRRFAPSAGSPEWVITDAPVRCTLVSVEDAAVERRARVQPFSRALGAEFFPAVFRT